MLRYLLSVFFVLISNTNINAQTDTINVCQYSNYVTSVNNSETHLYPCGWTISEAYNFNVNHGTLYFHQTDYYSDSLGTNETIVVYYEPEIGFAGLDTFSYTIETSHENWHSEYQNFQIIIQVNDSCIDCQGVIGGFSIPDSCGLCFDSPLDSLFNETCIDCASVVLGNSSIDSCGVCSSPENFNTTCTDCEGVLFGEKQMDKCGSCLLPTDVNFDACLDCFGVINGIGVSDSCGVCVTPEDFNSSCTDCQGTLFGEYELDECGNCLLPNDTFFNSCLDCRGLPNGDFYLDSCGNCVSPDDLFANRCTPESSKIIGDTVVFYLDWVSTNCAGYVTNYTEHNSEEEPITYEELIEIFSDCAIYSNDHSCNYELIIEGGELIQLTNYNRYSRLLILMTEENVTLTQRISGFFSLNMTCTSACAGSTYLAFRSNDLTTYFVNNELVATTDYYDCNNVLNGSSIVDTCGICLLPQNPEFNACADSVETSINNIELITNIFPNPAKNNITVQQQNLASVNIFDVTGKLIFTDKTKGANQLNINCSAWQAGIYFLEAKNLNGQITTQKIIVE